MKRLSDTSWSEMTYPQRQFMMAQMQKQCGENQQCIMADLEARDGRVLRERHNAERRANYRDAIRQTIYANSLRNLQSSPYPYSQPRFGY